MTLKATFGANVRHYRQARNLKQHELAEAIDKTSGMIGKIERVKPALFLKPSKSFFPPLPPQVLLFSPAPDFCAHRGAREGFLGRVPSSLPSSATPSLPAR